MFVIALVSIMSVSRVVRRILDRRVPPSGPSAGSSAEIEEMRLLMDGMMGRLDRLEEERDFFKDLLDAPGANRGISPPDSEEDGRDATSSRS